MVSATVANAINSRNVSLSSISISNESDLPVRNRALCFMCSLLPEGAGSDEEKGLPPVAYQGQFEAGVGPRSLGGREGGMRLCFPPAGSLFTFPMLSLP